MRIVRISDDPSGAREAMLTTLRAGGVVLFPTDTVYGIGGDATDPDVHARIAHLKERDPTKPFPRLVADMEIAKRYGVFSATVEEVLKRVWPGATTFIVPALDGRGSIGLRIPDDVWLLSVLAAFGKPIIGTSANPSGGSPATTAAEAAHAVPGADLLIDGGVRDGASSEVIDATRLPMQVLRRRT